MKVDALTGEVTLTQYEYVELKKHNTDKMLNKEILLFSEIP